MNEIITFKTIDYLTKAEKKDAWEESLKLFDEMYDRQQEFKRK